MYAIFRTGSYQYLASEGDKFVVPLLAAEPGTSVKFEDVLLLRSENYVLIGTPRVENVVVEARVIEHVRNPKVTTMKFRRRERSERRKMGHIQQMTMVEIARIGQPG